MRLQLQIWTELQLLVCEQLKIKREKKRLCNISPLLIDHAAQSIMGSISHQSVLIHQHSFTDDPL